LTEALLFAAPFAFPYGYQTINFFCQTGFYESSCALQISKQKTLQLQCPLSWVHASEREVY